MGHEDVLAFENNNVEGTDPVAVYRFREDPVVNLEKRAHAPRQNTKPPQTLFLKSSSCTSWTNRLCSSSVLLTALLPDA